MDPWIFDMLKIVGAALIGFLLGRLSKLLDRHQEAKDAEQNARAQWALAHSRGSLFTLTNTGAAAQDVELTVGGGGLVRSPGSTFPTGHTESFMIQHRGDGTISIGWTDHRGKTDTQTYPIPPKTN